MAKHAHNSNIHPLNGAGKRVLNYQKGYQQAQMKKDHKIHQLRRTIGWALTAFILVVFVGICFTHWKSYQVTASELAQSKTTLKKNKAESKTLAQEIKNLHNDSYLQKYIREKYMYSKDGELIFNLPDEK